MIERLQHARTFRHGVHPGTFKEQTADQLIERMPFPTEVVLHLRQHLGAPSKPVVRVGERVFRGQLVAEAGGFVSVPLHASATGVVTAIEKRRHPAGNMSEAIVIAVDPNSPQALYEDAPHDWETPSRDELVRAIQAGGFVGLGGAAFPTHVKLSVPEGKRAEWVLINGAECEPYLTTDHRLMLESADSIILGIRITMKVLGAHKAFFGIENNKLDAIQALRDKIPADLHCEIVPLETKYPQGAEKMLITAVLSREVPSGRLPIDVEVVVNNVGTVAAMGDFFGYGQPLIERVVTVSGPGVHNPSTLLIPLGTKLSDVLAHCGGVTGDTNQILFGGPMMGAPQYHMDVPVLKGTSGILCLTHAEAAVRKEYACIRCSSCLDACPVYLNPSILGQLARTGNYESMRGLHLMDCMECGSCSYVCPSNIPLVQRFRVAKALLREEDARQKDKEREEAARAKAVAS
ncbi:MAG TPA: electron transport complex subunit RsxC [Candidatus Krumholzibacteria bacterium]|nr:electron transport complex subunit RsxC [Candidatus Krumholzibacteria bacterium]